MREAVERAGSKVGETELQLLRRDEELRHKHDTSRELHTELSHATARIVASAAHMSELQEKLDVSVSEKRAVATEMEDMRRKLHALEQNLAQECDRAVSAKMMTTRMSLEKTELETQLRQSRSGVVQAAVRRWKTSAFATAFEAWAGAVEQLKLDRAVQQASAATVNLELSANSTMPMYGKSVVKG